MKLIEKESVPERLEVVRYVASRKVKSGHIWEWLATPSLTCWEEAQAHVLKPCSCYEHPDHGANACIEMSPVQFCKRDRFEKKLALKGKNRASPFLDPFGPRGI